MRIPLVIASAIAIGGCAAVRQPAYDTLISHRGESKDAPENTMAAYETAVERGFGFECDVYMSSDRKLFTFHDGTLTRTTAGANTNDCMSVGWHDTISKLNVGGWGRWKRSRFDPSRPALLSEVLSLARPGRKIYVEVKGDYPDWVADIREELLKAPQATPDSVVFISFGARVLTKLKQTLPEYRCYYLMGARKGWKPGCEPWTADEVIARLKATGADGIDIQFDPELHDELFVARIRDAGYSFHVWTIDNLDRAKRAFEVGAETVTTNCARDLLNQFEEEKK